MSNPSDMDPECVTLYEAIKTLPGIQTTCSCCGHGKRPFRMWLRVNSLKALNKNLPILLFYTDPCHVGFRWNCIVYTDCGMSKPTFLLESLTTGKEAYEQADIIARKINNYMKLEGEV